MIPFFRKIRKKYANNNQFIKYSRYAIGEIVLVVIGILIALSINNWNENRNQEKKIIEALKVVHRELSGDIQESNDIIQYYKRRDSVINNIMTKELTAEDYRGSNGLKYVYAATGYDVLTIDNNGFETLMSNSNNLPKKYQTLVESLKNIYIQDQMQLDTSLKMTSSTVSSNSSYLLENTNWFSDFSYHERLSKDAIDYYLNDPHFKNNLSHYQLVAIQNYYRFVYQFRLNAEDAYKELTSILELENEVATDSTFYSLDVKAYKNWLGTYKDSLNTKVEISLDSDKLFFKWNDNDEVILLPTSNNSFIQGENIFFGTINLNSEGQAQGCNFLLGNRQYFLTKIK